MEQTIVIFEGVDRTGKSEISKELAKRLKIPYFKNASEHKAYQGTIRYDFHDAVYYEQNYMVQFLEQTGYSAIFDRGFVSEFAYSKALGRCRDENLFLELSRKFDKLKVLVVITEKNMHELEKDWHDEEYIPLEVAGKIMQGYREFASIAECDCMFLNTDSRDLNKQVDAIIRRLKMGKEEYDCYIASGWFNANQAKDLENIKDICKRLDLKVFSPKDEIIAAPDASAEDRKMIFKGNMDAIEACKFVIVNTRDKDMGTIFEAGASFQMDKPIIYYCDGLKGNFNLMLAQSGRCVATSPNELAFHIANLMENKSYHKEYVGLIE